jgi:hypothetical protein
MKRTFALIFAVFIHVLLLAQPQRLAMLPSIMRITDDFGETYVPSLCIDFFKDAPGANSTPDVYTNIKNADGSVPLQLGNLEFKADQYDKIQIIRDGHIVHPTINQPAFFSTRNDLDEISSGYQRFIREKISAYRAQSHFNQSKLENLQHEVWSYDILQKLGYIRENEGGILGYNAGKKRFASDFLSVGAQPTTFDIREVGAMISDLKNEDASSVVKLKIIKNSSSGKYLVFDKISTPIYKGSSVAELNEAIAERLSSGDVVSIEQTGFENVLRERALLSNLKKDLKLSYDKDVIVTTAFNKELWQAHEYELTSDFHPNEIVTRTENNKTIHTASIEVEAKTSNSYGGATIEGISTRKNALEKFFDVLVSYIKDKRKAFVLPRITSAIRKNVYTTMGLTSSDQLDVFIIDEGLGKTLVKIRNGKIVITQEYACK